jgi:NAD(P)H-flavin reductase
MNLTIKNDCKLVEKRKIADKIYLIKFSFVENFEWVAGQYVGITTGSGYRRSYSILDYDGQNLSFLIDTKPAGLASLYFESAEVGDEKQILGPYGKFVLQDTSLKKIFIATGTGIAPLIPMIKEAFRKNIDFEVYFGVKLSENDYAFEFIKDYLPNLSNYHLCITQEEIIENKSAIQRHKGRVTDILPQMKLDFERCEFYICGAPQMVLDTQNVLSSLGAKNILVEKY